MRERLPVFVFLVFFPALSFASVLKVRVNAAIQPVTSEYVRQAIDRADRESASLLILALDTPGGLDSSMREIIAKILSAKTPVAAYVSPSGARAASAGLYIAAACDLFIMAPGTSTGAAHPVSISIAGPAEDKTMEDKVLQDALSYMKTLAEKRGRNARMAADAVSKSASYTEKEALEGGLIDAVLGSDREIIEAFEGKTIRRFSGAEAVLHLRGEPIVDAPMSGRQKFLLTISNPNLAYILLMLGLLGLFFEFAHPGAILPGVIGAISLLLAFFAFQILPVNYVGLALILLGVGLFVLELKVHTFGALTLGGLAAVIIGSLMLIRSPAPELKPSLQVIIPVALGVAAIFLFLVTLVIRAHRRKVTTGMEGMIGEIGTARTDLDPAGTVFVHGELWRAEADGFIPEGTRVRVIEAGGHLLLRVVRAEPKL